YLCVALGFTGKYQVLAHGEAHLADVRHGLYRSIKATRGSAPDELSISWRGVEDRRHRLIRYVPWWVVGAAALAILAVTFVFYYARLGNQAAPVHEELAKVGLEGFSASQAAPPSSGPTLKTLLESEVKTGSLSVDEQGGRTVVTPIAPDLFASGSAAP